MKSKHSYKEMEEILSANGFLIYEHLNYEEMNNTFFAQYKFSKANK